MVDVSRVDTTMTLFGRKYPYPIAFAPSAMQKLAHPKGEESVALAAHKLGVNMSLSSQSTTSLEDVAALMPTTSDGPERWFQLYMSENPELSIPLIERAASKSLPRTARTLLTYYQDAGYTAVVVTVDTPILGNRLNERKTPLVLPSHLYLANYATSAKTKTSSSGPSVERLLLDAPTSAEANRVATEAGGDLHSRAMTWTHTISWLRKVTPMRIILKGVMTEEDAELAVEHGADAIVVSNHGGRQLDSAPSTLEALPSIAEAVKGRIPVLFDGGVRHGSDVFKALALGADLVLVGRPVLWGMSYDGQAGVELAANILERELSRTMTLAGAPDIASIKSGFLGVRKRDGFGIARL
jgi:(S)-2-hydroxy-acid oxidase